MQFFRSNCIISVCLSIVIQVVALAQKPAGDVAYENRVIQFENKVIHLRDVEIAFGRTHTFHYHGAGGFEIYYLEYRVTFEFDRDGFLLRMSMLRKRDAGDFRKR